MRRRERVSAEMADFEGGELVVTGGTDWAHVGRTGGKKTPQEKQVEAERALLYPNLDTPHRVKNLLGIKIRHLPSSAPRRCRCPPFALLLGYDL
jgi:hypothetical protein